MLLFPKVFRKKKPPKRLKRSYKPIAKRSVFKAHGDNAFKTYRRRFTDYQVMVRAEVARQARLRDRTRAEMAFCAILDDMRVLYESEKIFLNGDRFVLIDAYVKSSKVAFEIDGSAHDDQKGYDDGRDKWLLRAYGARTVRFTNSEVFCRRQQRTFEGMYRCALPYRVTLSEKQESFFEFFGMVRYGSEPPMRCYASTALTNSERTPRMAIKPSPLFPAGVKDITEMRFHRLTAVSPQWLGTVFGTRWLFKCECGTEKVIRYDNVVLGGTRSCGCLRFENGTGPKFVPADELRLRKVLAGMRQRCHNPWDPAYKYYGARGIEVCWAWRRSKPAFIRWALANGYKQGLQIDRKDNYRGYEPSNCRFVTPKENMNNLRRHQDARAVLGLQGLSGTTPSSQSVASTK